LITNRRKRTHALTYVCSVWVWDHGGGRCSGVDDVAAVALQVGVADAVATDTYTSGKTIREHLKRKYNRTQTGGQLYSDTSPLSVPWFKRGGRCL